MRSLGILVLSLGVATAAHAGDEDPIRNSPKLMLRTSAGLLRNSKTKQNVTTAGGMNFGAHYFLTPQLSAGIAYKAELDIKGGTTPLKGIDISGRWYPWGQGTHTSKRLGKNILEFHPNWATYLVGDFSQRSYYLPTVSDPQSDADYTQGSFFGVNAGMGMDIRLSRHFEWNVEAITTVLSLAANNSGTQIKATLLNTGLNYVW